MRIIFASPLLPPLTKYKSNFHFTSSFPHPTPPQNIYTFDFYTDSGHVINDKAMSPSPDKNNS